jgi:hemerythrin-like metal-binding protein
MPWDERPETGHAEIDSQHRVIFALIDRVEEVERSPDIRKSVQVVLDLVKYVVQHFGSEEELMTLHAYPGRDEHRRSHAQLSAHVVKLRQDIAAGNFDAAELRLFLDGWINSHIGNEDRHLAAFLAGRS